MAMDLADLLNPYVLLSLLMGVLVLYSQWFETPVSLLKPLPGPRAWPLVGNLPRLLATGFDFRAFHSRLSASFEGALFSYRVFGKNVVVIPDGELAKKAFDDADLCSKPKDEFRAKLSKRVTAGIETSCKNAWEEHREVLAVYLGRESTNDNMEQACLDEASKLVRTLQDLKGAPFAPRRLVVMSSINILCQMLFGKAFEHDDPALGQFADLVIEQQDVDEKLGLGCHLLPGWLAKLPFTSGRQRRNLEKQVVEVVAGLLNECGPSSSASSCFVSVYRKEMDERWRKVENNEVCLLDDTDLLWTCYDLITMGVRTTSQLLTGTLLFLPNLPEVQAKLQQDIADKIGLEEGPLPADKPKLPAIEAVLLETLRISRDDPRSLVRVALADVAVGNFDIPQGTVVVADGERIRHDAQTWKEPDRFNPDRFLAADGTISMHQDLMFFGRGKRVFPAESMATSIGFILLARILQRLTLSTPKDTPALSPPTCIQSLSGRLIASPRVS
ncbi:cytochrome P450 1A1-like [Diadema antillarum]|uniref:cytochrome P450 1A1-like n=1 Tax=Diadema antillarum TaxID=105358 RepID=UPI003A86FE6D